MAKSDYQKWQDFFQVGVDAGAFTDASTEGQALELIKELQQEVAGFTDAMVQTHEYGWWQQKIAEEDYGNDPEGLVQEWFYRAAEEESSANTSHWNDFSSGAAQAVEGINPAETDFSTVQQAAQEAVNGGDGSDGEETSAPPFTLQQVPGTPEVTEQTLMWGYSPGDAPDGGTGGIPADQLISFLQDTTSLDLQELGLIDDDGVDPQEAVSNITIKDIAKAGDDVDGEVTITTTDGQTVSAEASLGEDYINFLSNLVFDADGNSRLYMDTETVEGGTDAGAEPIRLTPAENNGGTEEVGTPSAGDDTIVAGRTGLLHEAYIDGGDGHNTLELDAKGPFAQPTQLLNIQEIQVQNLPNIYDAALQDDWAAGSGNSILDLSRASDLQTLVVTEGELGAETPGDLTLAGIRGDATARLEGGFSQTVNLHFGAGLGEAVNLELNLGDTNDEFHLNVAHNHNTLNIDSINGENAVNSANLGDGVLTQLNVTGDSALYIGSDLSDSFHAERPAVIDASGNTGGVELSLNGGDNGGKVLEEVHFIGTEAGDAFDASGNGNVTIEAGSGANVLTATQVASANITSGEGNDSIVAGGSGTDSVTVEAGDGNNTVNIDASTMSVTTGAGDDTVVIEGNTYYGGPGAMVTADLGAGSDMVKLGDGAFGGVTALPGSSVSGENVHLYVEDDSDLSRATLEGVTAVTLNSELTLTGEQFGQIGPGAFSAENGSFGTTQNLNLVIDQDTTLSDLGNLSELSSQVRLNVDLQKGAELTLTAEQLHKHFAEDGISSADGLQGKVVIQDAGQGFNAFANGTNTVAGPNGGSLDGSFSGSDDVTIVRAEDGFNRPEPGPSSDIMTIDSVGNAPLVITGDIETEARTLNIEGTQGVEFDGAEVDLNDNFTVDFSTLEGQVTGLTLQHFEDITVDNNTDSGAHAGADSNTDVDGSNEINWGQIIGNGMDNTRINMDLHGDVGYDASNPGEGGFHSQGVPIYVATDLNDGDRIVHVCDSTQDVNVLGLQGNYGDELTYADARWDTTFLMEGDGAADWTERPKADTNPDQSNIGTLHVDLFHEGGPAVIDMNNQGTQLGQTSTGEDRALVTSGIKTTNAASLTVNVSDGDAVIEDISEPTTDQLETMTFNSEHDVTVQGDLEGIDTELVSLDLSGVSGDGTLQLNTDATTDLSDATVNGLDAVVFDDGGTENAELALSLEQVNAIGTGSFSTADDAGESGTLHVYGLDEQELDLAGMDVGNIGEIRTADIDTEANGPLTLNANTDLGGADSLTIVAEDSNTAVEMTSDQFGQLDGAGQVDVSLGADPEEVTIGSGPLFDGSYDAQLVLNDLGPSDQIDLGQVDDSVLQKVQIDGIVANADDPGTYVDEQMKIQNGHNAQLEVVGGDNDLTNADLGASFENTTADNPNGVRFTGDGSLTLTAEQVANIEEENFSAASGVAATLNIDGYDGTNLDLNEIQDAGINIGTINVDDTANSTVTANGTMGGADEVVVPDNVDSSGNDIKDFQLTAAQFQQLDDGTISGAGSVDVTDLTEDQSAIDLSNVSAENGQITLGANDVTLEDAAVLNDFAVVLNDVDSGTAADELAGQTIRFANAVQAERDVLVEDYDGSHDQADTNVAWLFNSISGTAEAGKVNTDGYDGELGRLWVNDELVDGANVEELYTSIADHTTVRVENTAELDTLLLNQPVDRKVEVESYTELDNGLVFNDEDKLEGVKNLDIDLGGAVDLGPLTLDNILDPNADNDDEFGTLTIKSVEAGDTNYTYLLPDGDFGNGPGQTQYPDDVDVDSVNVIGDIASGTNRDELSDVVLNTATPSSTSPPDGSGAGLEVQTIFFSDDTGDDPTATLTLEGANDIQAKSLDTSDAEITNLNVDAISHSGTFTVTGGSPAAAVANTETLVLDTGSGANTTDMVFGTEVDGSGNPYAGVAGPDLSSITVNGEGDVDLGVIAQLDGTVDSTLSPNGFQFTEADSGDVSLTLGAANVDGNVIAPELGSGEEWHFHGGDVTLTEDVTLNNGGVLDFDSGANLTIEGDVDLTVLNDADLTMPSGGVVTVPQGNTLSVTASQVDGVAVEGAGTLEVSGDASTASLDTLAVANIDLSAVTSATTMTLGDVQPESGVNVDGYTITGSDQGDDVTLNGTGTAQAGTDDVVNAGSGNDSIDGGSGDDTLNGGSGDDRLVAGNGGDTLTGDAGNDTFEVDAGSATVTDLVADGTEDDVLQVASGATATANGVSEFTATAATSNDGTAILNGTSGDDTIDVSAAGGGSGWTINGGSGDDTLTGSSNADSINGGAGNDTIEGGSGNDTINGGSGDDTIVDFIGADTVDGGAPTASDTLELTDASVSGGATADLNAAGDTKLANVENIDMTGITTSGNTLDVSTQAEGFTITGSSGDDAITGGQGADSISGGSGNDTLTGHSGNDTLIGGSGDDVLYAEDTDALVDGGPGGNDFVKYQAPVAAAELADGDLTNVETVDIDNASDAAYDFSNQTESLHIVGYTANDTITGGTAADTITGIDGDDVLHGESGDDTITGGSGDDTINGGSGDDTINGNSGADELYGDAGNDILIAESGDDIVDGGSGDDTVRFGATVAAGSFADGEFLNVGNVELTGTGVDVDFSNQTEDLSITGASGANSILGGSGDDTIDGAAGADTLAGQSGDDTLVVDGSDNVIDGGVGTNTVEIGAGGTYSADFQNVDSVVITNTGDATYDFSGQGPTLDVTGNEGDDNIIGTSGDDTINGGSGDDTLQGSGGDDSLNGGSGADSLIGGSGLDILDGEAGNDTLSGGPGDDLLTGGSGDDIFSYADENWDDPNNGIQDFDATGADEIHFDAGGGPNTLFSSAITGFALQAITGTTGATSASLDSYNTAGSAPLAGVFTGLSNTGDFTTSLTGLTGVTSGSTYVAFGMNTGNGSDSLWVATAEETGGTTAIDSASVVMTIGVNDTTNITTGDSDIMIV